MIHKLKKKKKKHWIKVKSNGRESGYKIMDWIHDDSSHLPAVCNDLIQLFKLPSEGGK